MDGTQQQRLPVMIIPLTDTQERRIPELLQQAARIMGEVFEVMGEYFERDSW